MKIAKEDILGYECKNAVYIRPPKGEYDDYHLVKENIHLKDGRVIPHIRFIKNYKRPFWVTKKGCRNHKQKKEREYLSRLEKFECTQTQLMYRAAAALEMPWFKGSMRDLQDSPYLYGTDISSTALIKGKYKENFPELHTPSTVAAFDTETYMDDERQDQIIMATVTMGDKAYTAVRKDFFNGHADVDTRLKEQWQLRVKEFIEKRHLKWEYELVDTEIETVIKTIQKAHEWKPDYLAIWNMNFDIKRILEACDRAKYDPADIFSDPAVPINYRFFRYKEGKNIKKMASGKTSPISNADQWHTVFCPASFYIIDAMCCFRKLRVQKGELPHYNLDFILKHEKTGITKMKFEQAAKFKDAEWHVFMQENYPVEYTVYNVFDCIAIEVLDEKTMDMSLDIPESCAYSDYTNFESQPKRVVDELHHFLLNETGSVIGSTGKNMIPEEEKKILPPNTDLIVNLKAYLITEEGLKCIEQYPDLITRIYTHAFDLDVSAAYPSNTIVFNVSKETNKAILCRVEGMSINEWRMNGINFSGGHTNSVEFATAMFGLPQMTDVLSMFVADEATNDFKQVA